MQVPSLKIQSTHGQIGLSSQRPHLEIQQHKPAMSIKQEHASIEISHQASSLTIDQRQAFASANSKHIYQLNDEWVQKALSQASQATAKYAREGSQMMRIENGGNVIPHLAKTNSIMFPEKQVTIAQMPQPFSVRTNYQPSSISMNVRGGTAQIQVDRREPTIQHKRWQTDVYLQQKNNISFQVVGAQVNFRTRGTGTLSHHNQFPMK